MANLALRGGVAVRYKPYPDWPQAGSGERDWLEKVLASGRWFAGLQGGDPEALGTLFAERFANLHDAQFALPVANGSVAIEIALRALGTRPGDEVIVPAYTFISTATSVLMVGGVPVFADMDPQTYCLAPEDVARRVSSHTRAVIPVHLGGQMADMPAILKVAEQYGVHVVEDCAQAIHASLDGRKAGTWGHLGTFSFQSNKTITAGEGGLVTTNDPELAEKVVALRAFGRFQGRPGVRSSDLTCERVSSNYRLSEFQAAVLLAQLERFPLQDARRQANAARLTQGIEQIPGLRHIGMDAPSMKHGYYYYLLRYEPQVFGDLDPDRLCEALNAEGIPFVPGDRKPLYRHPVFEIENLTDHLCPQALERYLRAVDLLQPGCPATEEACGCTLILRHQVLLGEEKDMDDIIEALWKVYKNREELR
ncbi:MAG: DegT/DnrJ/EryC1/StrS family aminotransferase [Deltaproteobacteria bacterium]|nr:MAG: DegT/DnrJ/EryC1/StrS family aminotransferase [Deltaproteobacteria bacterium]